MVLSGENSMLVMRTVLSWTYQNSVDNYAKKRIIRRKTRVVKSKICRLLAKITLTTLSSWRLNSGLLGYSVDSLKKDGKVGYILL